MEQSYSSTKLPTAASTVGGGGKGGGYPWTNPTRITANDGSSADWGAAMAGEGATITGSAFGFPKLPDSAVIDGIQLFISGSQIGAYGDISISPTGTTTKPIGALNGSYGGPTDLWGATVINPADIATLTATAYTADVSGGDAIASMDYMSVTVYWHIDAVNTPSDVPTRIDYKTYSRDGTYLGLLPNVTSKLSFSQDINSAGSSIQIKCGKFIDNESTAEALQDNTGAPIQTESGLSIMARSADIWVAAGASDDEALFKNSNRVKAYLYNKWYPNGKLVFSGQVNKVAFEYGGGNASVDLTVYSDGIDLDNYIARGYPFNYTLDQSQTTQNGVVTSTVQGGKGVGWTIYGQTFITGSGVTNIGAIDLLLRGSANVQLSIYDGPNGNYLGGVTKTIAGVDQPTYTRFELPTLLTVTPLTPYFIAIWVDAGQSIDIYRTTSNAYASGSIYVSNYSGGSGGGSFTASTGDIAFKTYSGTPTTTTTYSTDDPVTDMARGILLDYNARGGAITERDFVATGLSLTYTFNSATIYDAIKKIIELSPNGYYSYVDLGTAEIDIKPTSTTPDFTIVRGREINKLNIGLSIENVKNSLLFSGGDTGGGTNLFKKYDDSQSISNYGIRVAQKSDNRVTVSATADAVGGSFIDEYSDEAQETSVSVLNDLIDITLLTPGKTIGFKNFGSFVDSLVLVIARREPNFSDGIVNLVLGRLPLRLSDEIQRINRDLILEQTINNPAQPS